MPGTADNPVRLDPLQTIIEVGWPSRYYAFLASITNESGTTDATPCSPTVGSDNGNASNYMVAASMEVDVGSARRYVKNSNSWQTVSGATFDNEPTLPFTDTFTAATASATYSEPHRFTLAGGTAIPDVSPPAHPSESFVDSVDIGYEVIGRQLDPTAGVCNLVGVVFPVGRLQYPALTGIEAITSPAAIGIGDIVLNHNGRAYSPVGAYLVPHTKGADPTVEIDAPIEAWILCERTPA